MLQTIQKYLKSLTPSLVELFMLVLGFFTSLSLVSLVKRPLNETYDILNPLNATGFNPDNNYIGLVFIIVMTVALAILFSKLYRTKFRWVLNIVVILILVTNYVSLNMLADSTPAYADKNGYVDSFHGGEQLAPTQAYINGKKLYSELFFLRGAGVDVLFNALGFSILGQSVGSFLLLGDLFIVASLIAFLILLAYLVRNPLLFTLLATMFFCSTALSIIEFRDIVVWVSLGLLISYFNIKGSNIGKVAQLFALGFLASLSLYISIDRGVMLITTSVLLMITLIFFKVKESGLYIPSLKTWRSNIKKCIPLTTGLLLGISIPGIFIGFDGFGAFLKMTFLEIPKYGGLLVSQPYPGLFGETYLYWGPVFVAIATVYLLYKLVRLATNNYSTLIPYGLILFFSLLSLKIGSNRIALPKLATATTPLYLVATMLLIFALVLMYKQREFRSAIVIPSVLLLTTLMIFIGLDTSRILQQPDYSIEKVRTYIHNVRKPDNELLSPDVVLAKKYIQSQTDSEDYIYSFTSNPIYYYASSRKNPSRFSIGWFTDPQPYSDELLESLKDNQPKLVVYADTTWTDAPDGIPMQLRIPEVDKWILTNYQKKTIVGNITILQK